MKSLVFGFSTLLALSTAPASAQVTYGAQDTTGVQLSAGPDFAQDGAGAYDYDSSQPSVPQPMVAPQAPAAFAYFGQHPVPYDQGGGFCAHTGAHEHPYPVFDRNLFRMANGMAYFVGDPADFGYQDQSYVYRTDHPIEATYGGGFCYMNWMHRHLFAPIALPFNWDGGAYVYAGAYAPAYYVDRPYYANYFNGYYRQYYLGGNYYYRRPAPIYGGWGWHRPVYGNPGYRSPGYYNRPWGRPGYVAPPAYRYSRPYTPVPVYRAPMYRAPGYRAAAPIYNTPAYRAPMQGWRSAAPGWQASAPGRSFAAPAWHSGGQFSAPAWRGGGGGHFSAPAWRGGGGGGGGAHFSAPAWRGGGGGGAHFSAPAWRGGGGGHFRR